MSETRKLLARAGITQNYAARICGVTDRAFRRFIARQESGEDAEAPLAVRRLLGLMVEVPGAREWLEADEKRRANMASQLGIDRAAAAKERQGRG